MGKLSGDIFLDKGDGGQYKNSVLPKVGGWSLLDGHFE